MDEKALENNQDQADGSDESNASEVGGNGSTIWTNSEIRGGNDTNISGVFFLFFIVLYSNGTAFI